MIETPRLLTLTESASHRMLDWVEQTEEAIGVRVSTKKSGCSGYSYQIEICCDLNTSDWLEEHQTLRVYIDQSSIKQVSGMEIDCVQEGLNRSLVFNNPNAINVCGCGNSFGIK